MAITRSERQFWNSPDITRYFESKPADPRIVAFMEHFTETHPHARVLDLGCGGGRHSELLASLGHLVTSVDVNPGMLVATHARLDSLGLVADIHEGSILAIPADNEVFDIVVTTGVLHQANTIEEYVRALEELARVTKPSGFVLLNIFTNKAWDDTYTVTSPDGYSVLTQEGLPQTLLPRETFVSMMDAVDFELASDQGEEVKQENTGSRAVFRAFFQKRDKAL